MPGLISAAIVRSAVWLLPATIAPCDLHLNFSLVLDPSKILDIWFLGGPALGSHHASRGAAPHGPALLGRRVREIRKHRKLSQEGLAERAKMSSKFISQIKRGAANPSLDTLQRLAESLGLELWELVRFEERSSTGPTSKAARGVIIKERVVSYVLEQPPGQLERALRILEAALGEAPKIR